MLIIIKPGASPHQSYPPLCQEFHPGVGPGGEEVAPRITKFVST